MSTPRPRPLVVRKSRPICATVSLSRTLSMTGLQETLSPLSGTPTQTAIQMRISPTSIALFRSIKARSGRAIAGGEDGDVRV
jgi:hypothetical protein